MRLTLVIISALAVAIVSSRFASSSSRIQDDIALLDAVSNITKDSHADVAEWAAPVDSERPMYVPYPLASNEYWDKVVCHGYLFLQAMEGTNVDAGQMYKPARQSAESLFKDPGALRTWGWQNNALRAIDLQFDKAWGIDHVLRDIGVSDKATENGGKVHVLSVTHGNGADNGGGYGPKPYDKQDPYTVDGKQHRVTGADFTFGIEPNGGGVLIAMSRKSPQFAGSERTPKVEGEDLPSLTTFSDVAWLKWKDAMGSEPTSMRYFLTLSISNLDTRGVFGRVLSNAKYSEVPAWPGYEVDANTDDGAALLGTPNAIAFSYFLIQHKSTLGSLRITKIKLFKNSMKYPEANMLFKVEAVPAKNNIRSHIIQATL